MPRPLYEMPVETTKCSQACQILSLAGVISSAILHLQQNFFVQRYLRVFWASGAEHGFWGSNPARTCFSSKWSSRVWDHTFASPSTDNKVSTFLSVTFYSHRISLCNRRPSVVSDVNNERNMNQWFTAGVRIAQVTSYREDPWCNRTLFVASNVHVWDENCWRGKRDELLCFTCLTGRLISIGCAWAYFWTVQRSQSRIRYLQLLLRRNCGIAGSEWSANFRVVNSKRVDSYSTRAGSAKGRAHTAGSKRPRGVLSAQVAVSIVAAN